MNRLCFLLVLVLGLILTSWTQPARGDDHLEGDGTSGQLSALLKDFLAGASRNDRETHERFWAEDLIYTSSSGERFGKSTILAGLDQAPADAENGPVYSASEVQIRDFGALAIVTFRLLAHEDGVRVDQYFNTGVFRRGDQGWQAVNWHATRIP